MIKIQLVILAALTSLTLSAHPALAESSVWKISKNGNYFYLGGTIHLLTPADYPLPKEFNRAYADADTVIFETDLEAAEKPEFQAKFFAALTYDDGRTLAGELKPETYGALQAHMAGRYIPIETFAQFRPWGVSMMITVLEYQRQGMEPDYGVDAHFHRLARSDGKTILGLETLDEQLASLRSMEDIEPNLVIEYTLRDLEHLPEFVRFMKQAWRTGDIEAFTQDEYIEEMRTEFPALYEALIVKRNNAWMSQFPALVDDAEREFVMVGAMHLNGEDGLLSQLESEGFSIEQL